MRRTLAMALLTAVFVSALPSEAKAPAVTVGRITSEKKPSLQDELKTAVRSELRKLDLSSATDHFVLSASLVKLDVQTGSSEVQITAEVNAQLARKAGGTLRAVFRGRARATDAKSAAKSAELAALQGAVRSAIKNLPQAVR